MHIVFQLYDVLRFDSTVVINVLINISSLKLNNLFFLFRSIKCMNMLLGERQHVWLSYFAVANTENL